MSAAVDRITVSIVRHRLHAIVEEMGEAMLRTSYSQILNSSRDFSTALSDPDGRLVAQAEHVPIHVGALPWAVRSVHDAFRGRVRPGEAQAAVVPLTSPPGAGFPWIPPRGAARRRSARR